MRSSGLVRTNSTPIPSGVTLRTVASDSKGSNPLGIFRCSESPTSRRRSISRNAPPRPRSRTRALAVRAPVMVTISSVSRWTRRDPRRAGVRVVVDFLDNELIPRNRYKSGGTQLRSRQRTCDGCVEFCATKRACVAIPKEKQLLCTPCNESSSEPTKALGLVPP